MKISRIKRKKILDERILLAAAKYEAFMEGYKGFFEGLGLDDGPYNPETEPDLHSEYVKGWNEGEAWE